MINKMFSNLLYPKLSSSLYGSVVLAEGFVFPDTSAHYKMDEASGNIVNSGNGDNSWDDGVATGTPVYNDAGLYGTRGAIHLDDAGSEGFDIPGIFAGGDLTAGVLFYANNTGNGTVIFGNRGTGGFSEAGMRQFRWLTASGIQFSAVDNAGTHFSVIQTATIANFGLNHAHVELDVAGNTLKLFINNVLDTTTDITGHGGFSTAIVDGRVALGYNRQDSNLYSDIIVGEVYYVDRVLTSDERTSIYNQIDGIGSYTDLIMRITGDTFSRGAALFVPASSFKAMANGSTHTFNISAVIKEGYGYDGINDDTECDTVSFPSMADWAYTTILKTSTNKALNSLWSTDNGEYAFYVEQSGGDDILTFFRKTGSISYSVNLGVNALTDGVEHQIGFDRGGSDLDFYVDGESVGSVACTETIVPANNTRIGNTGTAGEFAAYTFLDDNRLYKATQGADKMKLLTALAA